MGDAVPAAQTVGHGMDIPHITLGEGGAGQVGGAQHVGPGFPVMAVVVGFRQVVEDELHGLDGGGPGALGGGAADVGFHCVGQRIHAGGGGQLPGQVEGHVRIEDCIMGDQREIVDGVFVVDFLVGDDGRQGGFAAGAGGGGHGDEQRQAVHHVEQALHLVQRLTGPHNAGAHGLGAVHGGTAAEGDEPLAAVFQVEPAGLLHVGHGGVRHRLVVDDAADVSSLQLLLQMGGQAQTVDAGVGDQHDAVDVVLPQHGGHAADAFDQFGLTIGQKRQRNAHAQLKNTAINLLGNVHFSHPFPLWTL